MFGRVFNCTIRSVKFPYHKLQSELQGEIRESKNRGSCKIVC